MDHSLCSDSSSRTPGDGPCAQSPVAGLCFFPRAVCSGAFSSHLEPGSPGFQLWLHIAPSNAWAALDQWVRLTGAGAQVAAVGSCFEPSQRMIFQAPLA